MKGCKKVNKGSILCFIGTHSTAVNGHHVPASGKSQMSVPDSADLPYSI